MINRAAPVRLTQGETLIVRYRNERRVGKPADHVWKARQIHAPMAGGDKRHAQPAQERQMQPIDMGVNDVEFARVPRDCLEQGCLRHHRVGPWAAKA